MKLDFSPNNPDVLSYTLVATATLGEWKQIQDKLGGAVFGPAGDFRLAICNLVDQASKNFYPTSDS